MNTEQTSKNILCIISNVFPFKKIANVLTNVMIQNSQKT